MTTYGEDWGREPSRKPKLNDGDTEMVSEYGRVIRNVDYRSHWFVLVQDAHGKYYLCVKHGGGEERTPIGYAYSADPVVAALALMTPDQRYLLLHTFHSVRRDAERAARNEVGEYYQRAFLEGRMKRRKQNHAYHVEITPEPTPAANESC